MVIRWCVRLKGSPEERGRDYGSKGQEDDGTSGMKGANACASIQQPVDCPANRQVIRLSCLHTFINSLHSLD